MWYNSYLLETTFSPYLGPIQLLQGLIQANRDWKFYF